MSKKVIASNRQAYHFYNILETFEAGIVLSGNEVKSIRVNGANLKEGFIRIVNGETYLHNVHIPQYKFYTISDYEPAKKRKLLLNKREIKKIDGQLKTKGLAVVPLELYFNSRGYAKILLGLAKGKKLFDKRESIKKKDLSREMEREFKGKFKI